MFLDEPFAALDAITREELQDDLLRLCNLHNMTVLFITHDISEAVYLSDVVAVMEQGEIVEQGTHEQLLAAKGVYARLHARQFHDDAEDLPEVPAS